MPVNKFGSSNVIENLIKNYTKKGEVQRKLVNIIRRPEFNRRLGKKVNKHGDFMTGNLDMRRRKITNLGEPTDDADAASKTYVDSRKPHIVIWAEMNDNNQWHFEGLLGYFLIMPTSGSITKGSIFLNKEGGVIRDTSLQLDINGQISDNFVLTVPRGEDTNHTTFDTPQTLRTGDQITLVIDTREIIDYGLVSLLIELDL